MSTGNYAHQFLFGLYPYVCLAVFFLGIDSLFGAAVRWLLSLA